MPPTSRRATDDTKDLIIEADPTGCVEDERTKGGDHMTMTTKEQNHHPENERVATYKSQERTADTNLPGPHGIRDRHHRQSGRSPNGTKRHYHPDPAARHHGDQSRYGRHARAVKRPTLETEPPAISAARD
jgi:hypothetical protein